MKTIRTCSSGRCIGCSKETEIKCNFYVINVSEHLNSPAINKLYNKKGKAALTWRMEGRGGWEQSTSWVWPDTRCSITVALEDDLQLNRPVHLSSNPPHFVPCLPLIPVLLPLVASECFLVASQRWLVRGSREGKPWPHWRTRARVWRRGWTRSGTSWTTWSVSVRPGQLKNNKS